MQLDRLKIEGIDNNFVGQDDDKPRQQENSVSTGFHPRDKPVTKHVLIFSTVIPHPHTCLAST